MWPCTHTHTPRWVAYDNWTYSCTFELPKQWDARYPTYLVCRNWGAAVLVRINCLAIELAALRSPLGAEKEEGR